MVETQEQLAPAAVEEGRKYSVAENMDFLRQRIEGMEAIVSEYAGTNEMPETFYEGSEREWELKRQIKDSEPDPESFASYIDLSHRQNLIREQVYGYEPQSAISVAISSFEPEFVGNVVAAEAEDGPLHGAMLEFMKKATEEKNVISDELVTLRHAYGFDTTTELLSLKDGEFGAKIRPLLHTENSVKWMNHKDGVYDTNLEYKENIKRNYDWMAGAVSASSGMTLDEAREYVFSASRKMDVEDTVDILGKIEHFGVERLKTISDYTGIHGLEGYTVEQLTRMEHIALDPEAVAAELANHDVTVVLVNRVGDHNGVMKSAAREFDDDSGRVVFFEINNMGDIYRRMVTLRRAGVKPSTMVLSAHSGPGQFIVSDDRDPQIKHMDVATVAGQRLVALANAGEDELKEGAYGYSMHGMQGMARLVDKYMQPSRGIDDDEGDVGRKKIVFQACYMGQTVDQFDKDENGEKIKIGEESVISQLGKDLLSSNVASDVDIYGGPDGIQMHRTEKGVRYSGQPEVQDDGEFRRTPLDAVRVRLEKGTVTQQNVKEILLRKPVVA